MRSILCVIFVKGLITLIDEVITINSESVLDTYIIGLGMLNKASSGITDGKDESAKEGKNAKDKHVSENRDEEFYAHMRAYQAEIGIKGEEFIIEKEKEKLKHTDYYNRIKHISKTNDSAGYDILSYAIDGTELYIEVKTTDKNHDFFYLTQNERTRAVDLQKNGKKYLIYRVINIMSEPTYFVIEDISVGFIIEPLVWKIKKVIN